MMFECTGWAGANARHTCMHPKKISHTKLLITNTWTYHGSNSCIMDSNLMTANNRIQNATRQHRPRTTTVISDWAPSKKSVVFCCCLASALSFSFLVDSSTSCTLSSFSICGNSGRSAAEAILSFSRYCMYMCAIVANHVM